MAHLEITVIPAGTRLYHGTAAEDEFEELIGPAWVSESEIVARKFGDIPEPAKTRWISAGRRPRILDFVAERDLELATIRSSQDFMQLARVTDPEEYDFDASELSAFACEDGYDGWIVPGNYGEDGSDIMLCDPGDVLEYLGSRAL